MATPTTRAPEPRQWDIFPLIYALIVCGILFFPMMLAYGGDGSGSDTGFRNKGGLWLALALCTPLALVCVVRLFRSGITNPVRWQDHLAPVLAALLIAAFIRYHFWLMIGFLMVMNGR
jgi:cation transport ATPase